MAKPEYKPVTHVIFAMDGLILNTDPITRLIINEICAQYNKGPLNLDLQHRILGRNQKDTINIVINELKLPIRFPFMKDEIEKVEARYGKAKIFPGAERLICHLYRRKIPMALATSSKSETILIKFKEYLGLYKNFHHTVSGSDDPDVPNSKPDPTIFRVCASRFDPPVDPESCLVIECSPAGVSAACCAGMQVVMVADPLIDPELYKDATQVVKAIADFKPEDFGLPPIAR